jgi:hypothetical protein
VVVSAARALCLALPAAMALVAVGTAGPAATGSWRPPVAKPSAAAQRVLDSLPEPARVPLPADLQRTAAGPPAAGRTAGADSDTGAVPGGCYEVQLEASADPAVAVRMADAAAVRLGVTTRVLTGGGLHRVRAGGCLGGAAAARLRERARAAGYAGAFLTPAR